MPNKPQRDFFASMTDLAGSRDSWFRDTSVDPKDEAGQLPMQNVR